MSVHRRNVERRALLGTTRECKQGRFVSSAGRVLFLPSLPAPLSARHGYSVCVYVNLPRIIHRRYSTVLLVVVLSSSCSSSCLLLPLSSRTAMPSSSRQSYISSERLLLRLLLIEEVAYKRYSKRRSLVIGSIM